MAISKKAKAAYDAAYRAANAEKVRAAKAAWCAANVEKIRAYRAEYQVANREKIASRRAAYYAANAKKVCARIAAYRVANLEKVRAKDTARQKANPAKYCARVARRNAAKLRATPAWADRAKLAAVYAKAAVLGLAVDHIVPLQGRNVCGLHVDYNLQQLTGSLNSKKGNRHDPDAHEHRLPV